MITAAVLHEWVRERAPWTRATLDVTGDLCLHTITDTPAGLVVGAGPVLQDRDQPKPMKPPPVPLCGGRGRSPPRTRKRTALDMPSSVSGHIGNTDAIASIVVPAQ